MGDVAPERWATVERLYHEALTRDPTTRAAYLSGACAGDDALRREVESLLEHDGSAAFLSTPAVVKPANHLTPTGHWLIAQSIGPYVISSRLGAGGMGEVYRARDQFPLKPPRLASCLRFRRKQVSRSPRMAVSS
jgi:hypothetical protein